MQLKTIFIFLPKGGLPPVSTDWSESTLTIVDFESHAASVEVCFDSRMKYELYMISSDRKLFVHRGLGTMLIYNDALN